jgi:hypothetical protein
VPLRIHKAEVALPPLTARPPAITLQELGKEKSFY